MGKRANGEGTISKRMRNGKVVGWRAGVTVGYDQQGRQIRRWVCGKTQAEVQDGLRQFQTDLHQGTLADSGSLTVSAYLDRWLEHKEGEGVKPNTLRSYRDSARLYLKPYLGNTRLEKLRPLDVQHLLTRLRKAGKSPALIAYALRVLKMALRQAVLWQVVPRNVADAVRPPQRPQPEMQVWTEDQVTAFLRASEGHRLHAAFYLALMTGMRRGEILGLRWADIDWKGQQLRVRNNLVEVRVEPETDKKHAGKKTVSAVKTVSDTPKTRASRRRVKLSPGTVAKLQDHWERQQQERAVLGPDWEGQDFVFADEVGEPTKPRTLYGWYRQLVAQAALPPIRFHDLRHTAASLMISRGLDAKTVSERLGHTSVAFTLTTYTHLYEEQRSEAAFDLTDLFPVAPGGAN